MSRCFPAFVILSSTPATMTRNNGITSQNQYIFALTIATLIGTSLAAVNLALGKHADQSSTHDNQIAEHAVDGNWNGALNEGSCTHTEGSYSKPWWRVDLDAELLVTHVHIVNRADCCPERLTDFTIGLTNTHSTPGSDRYDVCLFHEGPLRELSKLLTCTNVARGRLLFIQLNNPGALTLCEVEVYSYLDRSMVEMSGYRNNYSAEIITDANNSTCEQATTPASDKDFIFKFEIQTDLDTLFVTAIMDKCLDFPATMVYTEGDQSAMLPYRNNPSFCDNAPGKCVFKCNCSVTRCRHLFLVILTEPDKARNLCEIIIT